MAIVEQILPHQFELDRIGETPADKKIETSVRVNVVGWKIVDVVESAVDSKAVGSILRKAKDRMVAR